MQEKIEFYGDDQKIDFFVLQIGAGHFYFVRCQEVLK